MTVRLRSRIVIGSESKRSLLVIVIEAMKIRVMFRVQKSESEAVVAVLRVNVWKEHVHAYEAY